MSEVAAVPRFGVLTHSMHRPDQDPTLQLEQEIALAEHADRLGLEEFWWCERHTGGWQGVADPLLMVARASATTHRIRLGAAVSPVHHHPATLVDSALQLDHLTRGRLALGLATDVVDDDAEALGLTGAEAELVISDAVEAAAKLLHDGSPVLRPYRGQLDVRTVSLGASDGPDLAGRLGLGMVSAGVAAPVRGRENPMARAWERAEAGAARSRLRVSRAGWAAATPIHVASSEVEARRQVRHGIAEWASYARSAMPVDVPPGEHPDALVDALHATGQAIVGTPAMAVKHLERVLDLSGGVGAILVEIAGWANAEHTRASLELLAREVIPQLTGSTRSRLVAAGGPRVVAGSGGRRASTTSAPSATPAHGVGVAPAPRPATPPREVRPPRDLNPPLAAPTAPPPSRRGRHAGDRAPQADWGIGHQSGEIQVSAVVLRDTHGRVLTVRKQGTARFMFPGGKPEPGETPSQTAVRETREELGVSLDVTLLRPLGVFRAPAANEHGQRVVAVVFEHPYVEVREPGAEIAELRWQPLLASYPDDVAPLLAEHVLPALTR